MGLTSLSLARPSALTQSSAGGEKMFNQKGNKIEKAVKELEKDAVGQ